MNFPFVLAASCCRLLACLCLCLWLGSGRSSPAQAFCIEYLPLTNDELSLRFRQQLICDPFMSGNSVNLNRCTIRMTYQATLVVCGVDSNNRPWSVTGSSHGGYASVWSADLDRNGHSDLLFCSRTGANGWAPPTHLLVLMFDRSGRPMPWQCNGYFEVDKRGICDLLDLDRDGRAEIVTQTFKNGYWLSSLYEAGDGRFRLRQHHGTRLFPLYSKFTYRPNRLPSRRTESLPQERNLSNDWSTVNQTATLSQVIWPRHGSPVLQFSDGRKLDAGAHSGTLSIVLDEFNGRRIVLLSDPSARTMLEEIRRRQIPLMVAGGKQRVPQLLWAKIDPLRETLAAYKPRPVKDIYATDELP
jgi:hypothetical protein